MAVLDLAVLARLLGGVVLLASNGFFVGIEFAMTRVPQFDEAEFQGNPGLERAWEMIDQLEIYLSGCQVGITISSVGLGVVAEPAITAVVGAGLSAVGLAGLLGGGGAGHATLSVVLALGIVNLAHVIFGEQAPTYFGVERTRTAAKYGAPLLYWWTKLLSPVIAFADWTAKWLLGLVGVEITRSWQEAELEEGGEGAEGTSGDGTAGDGTAGGPQLSRAEVRREMGELLSRGNLDEERRDEVLNALAIGSTPVRDLAVPVEEVVSLSTADPVEESLERVRANPQHGRFPVFDGDGGFVGVVYATTLLTNVDRLRSGDRTIADVVAPPLAVPDALSVSELIDRFQAANQELAMVYVPDGDGEGRTSTAATGTTASSDGGTADVGDVVDPASRPDDEGPIRREFVGLVTVSDAFEAIAGEVYDPLDLGA